MQNFFLQKILQILLQAINFCILDLPQLSSFGFVSFCSLQWRRGNIVCLGGGSQRSEFSDKETFFPTKFNWEYNGQIYLNCRHF